MLAAVTLQQACATFGEQLRGLARNPAPVVHDGPRRGDYAAVAGPGRRAGRGRPGGSVAAFRTAIDTQFVEAVRSHHATTETLAESVGRINESSERLKFSSTDLQDTVNAHTTSFKALNRSLQQQVLPAHEAFLATITAFQRPGGRAGRAAGTAAQRRDRLAGEDDVAGPRGGRLRGPFSAAGRHLLRRGPAPLRAGRREPPAECHGPGSLGAALATLRRGPEPRPCGNGAADPVARPAQPRTGRRFTARCGRPSNG